MSKREYRKYKVSDGKYYCSECGSEMVRRRIGNVVELVCPSCGFRNLVDLKKSGKLVDYEIEANTPWGKEILRGEPKGVKRVAERRIDLVADVTYKVFVEGRYELLGEMRRVEREVYGEGKGDSNGQ